MGKALSLISNPFKNFNLESRAHKVISQPKPVPAPRHKKDQLDFERLMKEYPEAYQESLKKNEQLDKNLRDVYVTSHDPVVETKTEANPDRPLPTDRKTVGMFLYGVKEPNHVPLGKITLANALKFISKHQNEPLDYNAKAISAEYSIPKNTVKDILKHYRVFEVYIPQERNTKAKFAGPSIPKVQIIKDLRKELPPGNQGNEKT
ncbi:protein NDUFAF4 homolog [Anoplophora glabripennis]|uniref:protein NDUFAF4 homolog n=1 Tax=Anoplophora glabripennis TaxID=217634 RepID=UPI00087350DF|nr:protein NDUFAF4 homolog [Anoplophora glabripennis]